MKLFNSLTDEKQIASGSITFCLIIFSFCLTSSAFADFCNCNEKDTLNIRQIIGAARDIHSIASSAEDRPFKVLIKDDSGATLDQLTLAFLSDPGMLKDYFTSFDNSQRGSLLLSPYDYGKLQHENINTDDLIEKVGQQGPVVGVDISAPPFTAYGQVKLKLMKFLKSAQKKYEVTFIIQKSKTIPKNVFSPLKALKEQGSLTASEKSQILNYYNMGGGSIPSKFKSQIAKYYSYSTKVQIGDAAPLDINELVKIINDIDKK